MRNVLIIVPVVLVSACSTPKAPDPTPKNVGFQCLPVPSELMEAGSIFEVDQLGITGRIGSVDTVTVLKDRAVAFPNYSANINYKVGFLLSTLEKLTAKTGWSASLGADASSSASVSSTYGDLKLDITEGQPEANAEAWFKSRGFKVQQGKRYFFVREAIKAKEVAYEIKSADLFKLGGEAKVEELAKGKLDIFERQKDGSYKANGKFSTPLNVCIKPREIIAIKAATGQDFLKFIDVDGPISVTGAK